MYRLTLGLLIAGSGLALAAAHSYSIRLTNDTWIGDTELKPGNYQVEMSGDKAVLRNGKNIIEVPAKIEADQKKHDTTSMIVSHDNNKAVLKEIRLRGSKDMIVFP